MAQDTDNGPPRERDTFFLPDFCSPGSVLAAVLISQLVAVVLSLANATTAAAMPFWLDVARTSLFLLWIGLTSAAVLCYGRRFLAPLAEPVAVATALALLVLTTGAISEVAWWLASYWEQSVLPPGERGAVTGHFGFLMRNMLISLVVSAIALRYFYVSHQWRRNVEMEASARVEALQARIRPHFLFNSMNTIAALTRSDPAQAEEAIEDLADLFRASLKDADKRITLKEELEIARLYQRIEQLRLGDRLSVDWDIEDLPMRAGIPGLSLQPLLENAIYHGIEPIAGGGTVTISGRMDDEIISISVSNPVSEGEAAERKQSNRMALHNIRARFELAWGDRAGVECVAADDAFRVSLTFPYEEAGP